MVLAVDTCVLWKEDLAFATFYFIVFGCSWAVTLCYEYCFDFDFVFVLLCFAFFGGSLLFLMLTWDGLLYAKTQVI